MPRLIQHPYHSGLLRCPVRVGNLGNQSISDSTWTQLAFDREAAADHFDPCVQHDTSTNNSRITVLDFGYYAFGAQVFFDVNATGERLVQLTFNGDGVSTGRLVENRIPATGSSLQTAISISALIEMERDEYIEVSVWQNSTGALNILGDTAGPALTFFWGVKIQ